MNGNITSNSISYPFDGDEHPMLNYKLNENNLEIINSMGGNVICVYNNEIHHYWGENNNESECVEIGGIFTTDCNTDYYIRMNDSEF